MKIAIGMRVHVKGEGLGVVKEIDAPYVDVNWLTPDNRPSVLTSLCRLSDLTPVNENVLPQPRSKEWKRKSKEFYDGIAMVLEEEGL